MLLNIMKSQNIKNNVSKRSLFTLIFCMFFLNMPDALAAEYVYISDNLRVGVRNDPAGSDLPIGVVFTGMRLEVEDRSDGYVKIKTDKGLSGWIKDIYVTEKAPAIIQLNQLQDKYEKLKQEVSQGTDTSGALEKANVALNEQLDELKKERSEWQRERAKVLATQYTETSWLWLILVFVFMIGSFAAGAFWYRNQAMKKLGGLRV